MDDNRRAIDEAAALGRGLPRAWWSAACPRARATCPAPGAGSRRRSRSSPRMPTRTRGEAGDRADAPDVLRGPGVLSTLGQALDLAERFPPTGRRRHRHVPRVVGSRPARADRPRRRTDRRFQVCDWITPLPADALLARGMMGDGHIDFGRSRADPRRGLRAATSRSRSSTRRSGPPSRPRRSQRSHVATSSMSCPADPSPGTNEAGAVTQSLRSPRRADREAFRQRGGSRCRPMTRPPLRT